MLVYWICLILLILCSLCSIGESNYKVVCYFTNWAIYRPRDGSFSPEHINPDLCTHFIYAFAILNSNMMVSNDPYTDYDTRLYERVTSLQSKGKKVLISIGGHIDSISDKYSKLARNPHSRRQFAKQVTDFLIANHFNGLDVDWEFPVCWNSNCQRGLYSDKEHFISLLTAIRNEFNTRVGGKEMLLSIAAAADEEVVDKAYDLRKVAELCDWISIMGYEYHGMWENYTGLVAPFTKQPNDLNENLNIKAIVKYYLRKGVPRSKLILGMPVFGSTFTLKSRNKHGIYADATGPGSPGAYTKEAGKLAFYEIVKNIKDTRKRWKVVHIPNVGSFAYEGKQWVGYDDVSDVAVKSIYIMEEQIAGAMIWTIDMDHFMDSTCGQKFPIISTVSNILNRVPTYITNCT